MAKQKGGKKNRSDEVEREAMELVAPIVERYGYELWDIIFEKEGSMWYLKVLFDKPDGGISDDECEAVTAPINEAIDRMPSIDLIDVAEVGSPGLNRALRKPEHFRLLMGEPIRIALRADGGEMRYIGGTLCGYDEDKVSVLCEGKEESFPLSRCKRINLDL